MYDFKIDRMKTGEWGKIRAFFDVTTKEGFIIKGFKLVQGNDGLFVGFPSQKKDEEYQATVIPTSKELSQQLNHLAHNTYQEGGKEGGK